MKNLKINNEIKTEITKFVSLYQIEGLSEATKNYICSDYNPFTFHETRNDCGSKIEKSDYLEISDLVDFLEDEIFEEERKELNNKIASELTNLTNLSIDRIYLFERY